MRIARHIYETAQIEYEKVLGETRLFEIAPELEYARGYIGTISQLRNARLAGILQTIRQSESLQQSATSLLLQLDGTEPDQLSVVCVQLGVLLLRASDMISDPGFTVGASPSPVSGTDLVDIGPLYLTSSLPVLPGNPDQALLPASLMGPICVSRESIQATIEEVIVMLEMRRDDLMVTMQAGLEAVARGQDWPLTAVGTSSASGTDKDVEPALVASHARMLERVRSLEQSLEHEQSLLNTARLDRDNAFRNYSDVVGQHSTYTNNAAINRFGVKRTEVALSSAAKTPLAVYACLGLFGGMLLGSIAALSVEYGSRYRNHLNHPS